MDNRERWQALGQMLRRQRVVGLGFKSRTAFARHIGLASDRVLYDLEAARRDNYDVDTLISLESWYGLSGDELRQVLGDLYPLHDMATRAGDHSIQSSTASRDDTVEELKRSVEQISAVLEIMRAEIEDLSR